MSTTTTTPTNASLTGALSGTGHDIVQATVYTRAVPSQPPPELVDDVRPVYTANGRLQDWRLGSLIPGHHVEDATWPRFREWRATFAQDRFLGERALIRSFLDWLEPRCDISTLGVLRLPSGHLDFHAALKLKIQIEQAGRLVAAAHEDGIGLYSAGIARSALRVLIPTPSPTLLLGLNKTTLSVGPDGLTLKTSAAQPTLGVVTGWRAAGSGLVADLDGREEDLSGQDAATVLQIAGRQAAQVQVHDAPLGSLLAPVLVFLRDAAALAGNTGNELHFRSGWA